MADDRFTVATQRREEAPALLARSFPGLELRLEKSDAPFAFRHSTATAGSLVVDELQVSGGASAHGATRFGLIAAGVLVSGRFDVEYARHRIDTSRPFLRPAEPASVRMRDVHLRMVGFEAERFRAAADRYTDGDGRRRRLLRTRPISDDAAAAWRWTADRIHDTLREGPVLNPIVRDELFDLGVRMLLACFGEPVAATAAADVRSAPTAVRRAVAYLEEHASGAITVPDVAAAARVSPRSLQALFRRHLGVTPLAHLHAIRLDAARRDLLGAAGSTPSTVHEVAARWGFGNSGRFARLYSERFGERPSETLRLS